jgi:hypothetical protein
MSEEKKGRSSGSDRSERIQANLAKGRELLKRMEKKRNGRPKVELSEEEQAWRWRHLMRHREFLDDV